MDRRLLPLGDGALLEVHGRGPWNFDALEATDADVHGHALRREDLPLVLDLRALVPPRRMTRGALGATARGQRSAAGANAPCSRTGTRPSPD